MRVSILRMGTITKIAYLLLIIFTAVVSNAHAWTEPVRMSDSLGPVAPKMIAVGETLHVISTWPKGYYMRSNDNGLTWTDPVIPIDTSHRMDFPDLKYSRGLLHLMWKEVENDPPITWQLFHASSSDGGRSWSQPNQVFHNSDRNMSFLSLATKGDTLFLACAFDGYYLFFKSINEGLSWQDSSIIDSGPLLIIQPPILLYSAQVLHLIYPMGVDVDSFGFEIYYKRSTDFGRSWSGRRILSPAEPIPDYRDSQIPSAYADSSGHILVCWMDYKYGSMCGISGDIFYRVSLNNGATWEPWGNITTTQSGFTSSCLILGDKLHVSWKDFLYFGCGNSKIYHATSLDWGNTWSSPEMISGEVRLPDSAPSLTYTIGRADTVLHVVISRECPAQYLYYIRDHDFVEVGDDSSPMMPEKISLTAYPNPFNSQTTISYSLSEPGAVSITVFNILGQKVATLFDGSQQAGEHSLIWDAGGFSSALYFARLQAGERNGTVRVILLK